MKEKHIEKNLGKAKEEQSILDFSVFYTLKKIFGDKISQAVEKHSKNAKENIRRVEKALNMNDAAELEHAAHSIKGASAQFGAVTLNTVSASMEQLGKEGKVEEAIGLLDELKTAQADAERLMLRQLS